jgi:outer membrane protein assembly factor BamB
MTRVACLLLALTGLAADWPAWRGPSGDGQAPQTDPPLKWSATENVRWKMPLPDQGNSTPVVWGDRVLVTQASQKTHWPPKPSAGGLASAERRSLLCFSRQDGRLLWRQEVAYTQQESTHPTNPFCSASPATEGERVIVSHGSAGLYCYDFNGQELWRRDLGKFEHIWGNASSPVLYKHLVILWCGPGERQFLLAVDKTTGKTVWQHEEPGGDYGKGGNWLGSWATPIIVRVSNRDELILGVSEKVKAFDPLTGKELWSCRGLGKLVYTSPVCSPDGIVLALGGFHSPALAVKAGGSGDVTDTHRLWHHAQRNPQRIGSPVIVGPHAYLLNENGLAQCLELTTGKDLWSKERASGSSWGSMVHAAGRLYVTNLAGETFVFKASPQYELLARNRLGERTLASVAVADGELLIRTYRHLWCIGKAK